MAPIIEIDAFGNSSWDKTVYNLQDTPVGQVITPSEWKEIEDIFNQEITRRRNERPSYATPAFTGVVIDDVHYNDLANAMNNLNAYYTAAPGGAWSGICSSNNPVDGVWHCNKGADKYVPSVPLVTPGQVITAQHINKIKDELRKAGNSCFCNCNYCACNCNFCTCDCNFSCPCNCNYSDYRLKTNIEYI